MHVLPGSGPQRPPLAHVSYHPVFHVVRSGHKTELDATSPRGGNRFSPPAGELVTPRCTVVPPQGSS